MLVTLPPRIIGLVLSLVFPLNVKVVVLDENMFLAVDLVCTSEKELILTTANSKGVTQKHYLTFDGGKLVKYVLYNKIDQNWKLRGSLEPNLLRNSAEQRDFDTLSKFGKPIFQKICHGSLVMKNKYKNYMRDNRKDLSTGYYDDNVNRIDPTAEQ